MGAGVRGVDGCRASGNCRADRDQVSVVELERTALMRPRSPMKKPAAGGGRHTQPVWAGRRPKDADRLGCSQFQNGSRRSPSTRGAGVVEGAISTLGGATGTFGMRSLTDGVTT